MTKRSKDNAAWSPAKSEEDDTAAPRGRAADFVFGKLAAAILRGELAPGSLLPGERELADKFEISRVTIREAVHKLRELDLVRVRRGGPTIILDPAESRDPRLVALVIELSGTEKLAVRELLERQLMQGLALLAVVEGRLEETELDELDAQIDAHAADAEGHAKFIGAFWSAIARGTRNQFFWRETSFWFEIAMRRGLGAPAFEHAARIDLHREVVRRLRTKSDAAAYYLERIRPVVRMLTAALEVSAANKS